MLGIITNLVAQPSLVLTPTGRVGKTLSHLVHSRYFGSPSEPLDLARMNICVYIFRIHHVIFDLLGISLLQFAKTRYRWFGPVRSLSVKKKVVMLYLLAGAQKNTFGGFDLEFSD